MNKFHTLAAASLALSLAGQCAHAKAAPLLRHYEELALSADGSRVAALESLDAGQGGQRPHASVVVRDARSGAVLAQYDPCPACRYDAPAWSPDGHALAFIGADAKAGSTFVYLGVAGKSERLASFKGVGNSVRWSPDGRQLALLATLDAHKLTGAIEAGAPQVGEIGDAEDEQRIAVLAAGGGALKLVSPADTFIYEYDWTPDGKGFAVTSARGNGDNNWWIATLGHVDAASGVLRIVAAPKMQMNRPRVSPDGKTVAFIGGLMSDLGSVGGDVYTVALAGGTPQDITPGMAASFDGLAWHGATLHASALAGAEEVLYALAPGQPAARLWSAPYSLEAGADGRFSYSADGARVATVAEDFARAPRILAGAPGQLAAITHDNDALAPLVGARSIEWRSEGQQAQGWLLAPASTTPGKTYPMVVLVHGGPASAATPHYVGEGEQANALLRELTAHGYFVFLPNPRGSFGQGSAFTRANVRDFGGGDWRDILAGVDAVLAAAPVDGARLGLMGHSYGGFMTMWGVTHSTRFKAAVAGAGIANWISYYGQNGIDQWMIPYFGASAYDDPAVYRAASPIEAIKAARTPTLLYVGERDVECPAPQSVEFWHGLRAMGTPTALVIYEGEGHRLRKPEHTRDLRSRTLAWFDRYLK
ncbi:MAG: S9 family peptidase [Pseudomonadota bacterium]